MICRTNQKGRVTARRKTFPETPMRNRMHLALGALATALFGMAAHAATIIESEAGPARFKSLMTIENGKAKMQSDPVNYILIDPNAGQYLYILQEKKQIVDMNAAPPADPERSTVASPPPKVKLVHKGAGPKIAGYPTQRYQLFANGALCLSTYLSPEAMTRSELKAFHAGFARMQAKQKQAGRAAGMQFSPCEDAQDVLAARYPELGMAMRTVDAAGQLRQEVVNIETGAHVAPSVYELPQDFSRLTHEEFLRQMEGVNNAGQPAAVNKGGNS